MAQTIVSDFVIWAKHIYGDHGVAAAILKLDAGDAIQMSVEGVSGPWCRMQNGKDGRPTLGIRPLGSMRTFWKKLYESRRGQLVDVQIVEPGEPRIKIHPPLLKTEAERRESMKAFLSMADQGWRSDGPYGSRDEWHER